MVPGKGLRSHVTRWRRRRVTRGTSRVSVCCLNRLLCCLSAENKAELGMSGPSPELKRTDKLRSESHRFGFHSHYKRIELQFVGACQTKLLNARQERAKSLRKPAI